MSCPRTQHNVAGQGSKLAARFGGGRTNHLPGDTITPNHLPGDTIRQKIPLGLKYQKSHDLMILWGSRIKGPPCLLILWKEPPAERKPFVTQKR